MNNRPIRNGGNTNNADADADADSDDDEEDNELIVPKELRRLLDGLVAGGERGGGGGAKEGRWWEGPEPNWWEVCPDIEPACSRQEWWP